MKPGVSSIESNAAFAGSEPLPRKPPRMESGASVISVLSVSPLGVDHDALERLLDPARWTVYKAGTLGAALAVLARKRLPVVVCESDLGCVSWREMLGQITLLRHSPFLIVTSRLADEHLWVEALNRGAYDVLAKPFDAAELNRVLNSAWFHWRDCHKGATGTHVRAAGV